MIIILNGTSSAGKSTTAKALQAMMDAPVMHTGIDSFIFMLPKKYLNPPLWSEEVFRYTWNDDQTEILTIEAGRLGHQLMSGMHQSVAALARAGFPVIVDHVLLDQRWLQEAISLFADLEVLFVGLHCPLAVLEQREKDRQDRTLGQAKAQFEVVHQGKIYDLEIDTSQADAQTCAMQIFNWIESGSPRDAFRRMAAAAGSAVSLR